MKFIEVSEEPGRLTAIVADKIESVEACGSELIIRTVRYQYFLKMHSDEQAMRKYNEMTAELREAK